VLTHSRSTYTHVLTHSVTYLLTYVRTYSLTYVHVRTYLFTYVFPSDEAAKYGMGWIRFEELR